MPNDNVGYMIHMCVAGYELVKTIINNKKTFNTPKLPKTMGKLLN
jgi:hypothetical protein